MRDGIYSTFSCSVVVMLNLFLMMMRHILNIVKDYRDLLIKDVRKLMMHNDSGEQSLSYVCILKDVFSFLPSSFLSEGHRGGRWGLKMIVWLSLARGYMSGEIK